jgi:hypothetical protein
MDAAFTSPPGEVQTARQEKQNRRYGESGFLLTLACTRSCAETGLAGCVSLPQRRVPQPALLSKTSVALRCSLVLLSQSSMPELSALPMRR